MRFKCLFLALIFSIACAVLPTAIAASDDFSFGVQLFNRKRFGEAAEVFQNVIRKNPKNTNAIYYLGAALQNKGDTANASKFYKHLVTKFPRSNGAQYARRALASLEKSGHSPNRGRSSSAYSSTSTNSGSRGDYIPDSESVPFRRTKNKHLSVNCQINGRPFTMIFDTGAEVCVVGKNHLRQLAIPPPTGPAQTRVRGVGGVVPAWVMPATITLGKIRKTVQLVVMEKSNTPLLGQTFFRDLRYDIDNATATIRFKKPGAKGDYVPLDTINIPYRPNGNNILVTAKVNGRNMEFFFDTGAQGTLISKRDQLASGTRGWKLLGYGGSSGVGGSSTTEVYVVDSIELGPIRKRNMRVAVGGAIGHGLLGQDFFGRRRFTIDREKKMIRFYR